MNFDKGLIGGSSALLVLSLLSEKEYYGYEIIRTLEERSDETFLYNEGTLYPILHKMESKGLVVSYKEKMENGRERKYYQITKAGLSQLETEMEQWEVFSTSVNKVILGGKAALGLV